MRFGWRIGGTAITLVIMLDGSLPPIDIDDTTVRERS